jgi:hypothetical protein
MSMVSITILPTRLLFAVDVLFKHRIVKVNKTAKAKQYAKLEPQ